MAYDILIENARIVDGTGAPAYDGNIAIAEGRIAGIGKVGGSAKQRIDAQGRVAAPGFIDVHTHYDAQLCWDPLLGSSVEHGVTSLMTGSCGIGIAPCRPADRNDTVLDLVAVEGIAQEVLEAGIRWEFETFPEYMAAISRNGVGPNLGMLVPLTPLRRFVLGPEALERAATPEETQRIARHLEDAVKAGAVGFSASLVPRQVGWGGRPLASQLASRDELKAYCHVLRKLDRGLVQVNVTSQLSRVSDEELETLKMLVQESGRPVTWSGAIIRRDAPQDIDTFLEKLDPVIRQGSRPQAMIREMWAEMNLRNPVLLADVEPIRRLLNKPREELMRAYADPSFRAEFKRAMADDKPKVFGTACVDCEVHHVKTQAMERYLRRTVSEVAVERGADPYDTFFDLALQDDLGMTYVGPIGNADLARLRRMIVDPRIMIGMSDGGAHYDMLYEASYPTFMLGHWVRQEHALTLEHAVRRMTSEPADFMRLSQRGRLREGLAADITVFDPATIGSAAKPEEVRHDLPAGGARLYSRAHGISHVLVNGQVEMNERGPTGAMAGQFLGGDKSSH